MKRIPRDLSGKQLIKILNKPDYIETRQVGSDVRLSSEKNGTHHWTIPLNDPIKIGTLSAILNDVAVHFRMTKEELIDFSF